MDKNLVRVGDKVKAYQTQIGTIGTGNGQYWAHDHVSFSDGLSVAELIDYISGWSKEKVQKYYLNPHEQGIDWSKAYPTIPVDVGGRGYDWLQWIGYGYHPGVDVNSIQGGNSDFGAPIYALKDGEVIYEYRTWFANKGWGNIIVYKTVDTEKEDHDRGVLDGLQEDLKKARKNIYLAENALKVDAAVEELK